MATDDDEDEDTQDRDRNQEDESSAEEGSQGHPKSRLRWYERKWDDERDEDRSTTPTTSGSRAETEKGMLYQKFCGSAWKKVAVASFTIALMCAIVAVILYSEGLKMNRELKSSNAALVQALKVFARMMDMFEREIHDSECERYEDTFLNWLQQFCKIVNCTSELCHKYWTPFSGNCYFFSKSTLGWEEGRQACILQGSELLVIRSEKEQRFVAQHNASQMYWVGIKDNLLEASWTWVDGTSLREELTFWGKNYPDSYFDYNLEAFKNCVYLRRGSWANAVCSEIHYFICKRKSEMPPIIL
uniref:CD209 antigen-like protein C isoform X1 n=1 Tax=Pristiophorus japonicus TaxID=55135 RepID=UPI00398EC5E9